MDKSKLDQLTKEIIDRTKWSESLQRFIDVLKINIFVVDYAGRIIVPPSSDRAYGSKFLATSFGFDFTGQGANMIEGFKHHGTHLEMHDPLDLHVFAIPIKVADDTPIAYVIVGPVILNKRWDTEIYINVAAQIKLHIDSLVDSLAEIRVVSFVTIKATLDLLSQIAKDIVDLSVERKRFAQISEQKEAFPKAIAESAKDMYSTIHMDELLITVLDVALNLTQAECGSIMFLDPEKGEMNIKVSRGLDAKRVRNVRVKLGEGIAGIAAEQNQSFVISGTQGDNRIKHLLKRPEIKQSAVVPLSAKNRVFGVLNVHTKREEGKIEANEQNLQHLSKLISTAISSL